MYKIRLNLCSSFGHTNTCLNFKFLLLDDKINKQQQESQKYWKYFKIKKSFKLLRRIKPVVYVHFFSMHEWHICIPPHNGDSFILTIHSDTSTPLQLDENVVFLYNNSVRMLSF